MERESKFVLAGLPESGKSTFLAALWEVVRSDTVPGALKLGDFKGDYSYINKIHQAWLEGTPLSRTKLGREGLVELPLTGDDATETTMVIPDLSGEAFDAQWEFRTIEKQYYEHLLHVSGLLLFVHSQKFNPGDIIDPLVMELEQAISTSITLNSDTNTVAADGRAPTKPVPFDPKNVPTQTKVVDMALQAITMSKQGYGIRRIALVISAWDLVKEQFDSPTRWLEKSMPLLGQFLESNTDRFEINLYGISAQGVELNPQNQDEYKKNRREILNLANASDRIVVVERDSISKNISAPLQWLMRQ